jgi:arginine N-succinyltransferase
MLRRLGFYYGVRVDPFDGGPHFFADTADVTLIRHYRRLPAAELPRDAENEGAGASAQQGIVARSFDTAPYLRAVPTRYRIADDRLYVPCEVLTALDATEGDLLAAVPTT